MDARDIIADAACRPDWNKYETANYILQRLADAGFSVIHRDENHGPTMERAMAVAVETYGSAKDWDYFGAAHVAIASAIRAMGEKK